MDEPANRNTAASIISRDPTVAIMFGVAILLTLLIPLAGVVFARSGRVEMLEAVLVLTGIFALVGMGFGLVRGLRSARAAKRRSA